MWLTAKWCFSIAWGWRTRRALGDAQPQKVIQTTLRSRQSMWDVAMYQAAMWSMSNPHRPVSAAFAALFSLQMSSWTVSRCSPYKNIQLWEMLVISKTYCFHSFASKACQLIEVSSWSTSFLVTRYFTKRTSLASRSEDSQSSTGGSDEQQVEGVSSTSTAGAWEEHLPTEIKLTVPVHQDSSVWCKLGSIHMNCQWNYGDN